MIFSFDSFRSFTYITNGAHSGCLLLQGFYRRGAAYLAMGKFKEALKDFQQVFGLLRFYDSYWWIFLLGIMFVNSRRLFSFSCMIFASLTVRFHRFTWWISYGIVVLQNVWGLHHVFCCLVKVAIEWIYNVSSTYIQNSLRVACRLMLYLKVQNHVNQIQFEL